MYTCVVLVECDLIGKIVAFKLYDVFPSPDDTGGCVGVITSIISITRRGHIDNGIFGVDVRAGCARNDCNEYEEIENGFHLI